MRIGKILAPLFRLLIWIGRTVLRAMLLPFRPLISRLDSSPWLSKRIDTLSSAMATQRGLPIIIGTGLLIASFVAHGIVIVLLVSTEQFGGSLYWLCIPFTLLHLGILAGFTGTMLATPLGQGYKDK